MAKDLVSTRPSLLTTTATAAVLALAFAGGALAQGVPVPASPSPAPQSTAPQSQGAQSSAPQAGAPQAAGEPRAMPDSLAEAGQELRVAHQQMGTAQETIAPQAIARARLALEGISRSIDQAQPERMTQGATQALQQRVDQARRLLAAESPNALQARLAIDEVLAALPPVQAAVEQAAPSTGANAASAPAQSGGMGQRAAARASGGVDLARATSLVGTNVVASTGRNAGEVENLLIDSGGQVRAAVIEWGGFLGLGARRAVVPIDQLVFGAADEPVRMDLTRDQLESLPRYEAGNLEEYGRAEGWGTVRTYR